MRHCESQVSSKRLSHGSLFIHILIPLLVLIVCYRILHIQKYIQRKCLLVVQYAYFEAYNKTIEKCFMLLFSCKYFVYFAHNIYLSCGHLSLPGLRCIDKHRKIQRNNLISYWQTWEVIFIPDCKWGSIFRGRQKPAKWS